MTDITRLGLALVGFAVAIIVAGIALGLIGAGIRKRRGGSLAEGDVQRSLLVRITRATTINDFVWL